MERGRVAQVGAPREIYERPASRFVADFIGSSNVLPGRVDAMAGDQVVVRLAAGGEIRVPYDPGLGPGAAVSVVVRPDRLEVLDGAVPAGVNAVRGRVTKLSYLGTHFQIVLRIGDLEVTAHRRNPPGGEAARLPEVGDEVHVTWHPAQGLCFAE
jgi:ABC-type Fe3+/spermidine/putrescine transport system ATPase subunit